MLLISFLFFHALCCHSLYIFFYLHFITINLHSIGEYTNLIETGIHLYFHNRNIMNTYVHTYKNVISRGAKNNLLAGEALKIYNNDFQVIEITNAYCPFASIFYVRNPFYSRLKYRYSVTIYRRIKRKIFGMLFSIHRYPLICTFNKFGRVGFYKYFVL